VLEAGDGAAGDAQARREAGLGLDGHGLSDPARNCQRRPEGPQGWSGSRAST